jgi:undecaprenyl phosphate N,N'-diacetylbacillosamine 1-phosphate transferase
MYRSVIKPLFDIIFSLVALIILSPFLLSLILILIILNDGKPFFYQNRPGKNGRTFRLIKFRTMIDKADSKGALLPDNQRMTKIGKLMRSASIDELPQLVNILSGGMSFVGPRPLLTEYLPLYNAQQARRHEVRPGITGWAQVNGRNAITWTEKFNLDVWYVDNLTFLLDVKIFCKTIFKVITRQGINSSEQFTMNAFNGNN